MRTVERRRDHGSRVALEVRRTIAKELFDARRSAGVSQGLVAKAAGLSQARISRTERVSGPAPQIDELASHCAALGLRLVVKVYPEASSVRDAGHLRLLRRLRQALPEGWVWRSEVPVGGPGDLRAWDAVLDGPVRIAVDAETRLNDVQELQRRTELKRRDSGIGVVVLLVASTHHNRLVLREHRLALSDTFPLDTPAVMRALRSGQVPTASGIVVL
jgi:transcriptional regulator with XRE-family HTH domain